MKLIKMLLPVVFLLTITLPFGLGKPEYAKKEGKSCTFCHPAGKTKELTPAGQYYKDHDHPLEGDKAS
jgi:hypothetical protein